MEQPPVGESVGLVPGHRTDSPPSGLRRGSLSRGRAPRGPLDPRSAVVTAVAWSGACLFVASLLWFLYAYLVRFGAAAPAGARVRPISIDIVLFSVFALHHSLFARTSLKAWVRRMIPPVLERSLYTSIASVLFLVVCGAWQPVPGVLYRIEGPWRWLAAAAQLSGILLTFLGSKTLDVLDLAGVRAVIRARTAAAPVHVPLSASGVYGLVRHPVYFGWALLVCGAADMTATRAVFALVSTAYVALAIPWEERGLIETFGAAYEDYRRKVRWRMIPGMY